ncbi:MAG TPA: hypothetical protein VFP84_24880, partial [Kofleriaceae bacterium]|nr:hypothetical protein [Kofleriaceae bacterium]
ADPGCDAAVRVTPLAALVPRDEPSERAEAEAAPRGDDDDITSGAIAAVRIDGKGRGAAGGLGVVFARGKLEAEVLVLRSDQTGGYVGVRYRFLTGLWRPYASLGVPGFVFDHQELQADMTTTTSKQLALGLRLAAGLEVRVTHHLSVLADVGYEHFWFGDDRFDADLLVPSIGVIGRL